MKKSLIIPTISMYTFLAILLVYFVIKTNYEFIGYSIVAGILYYAILIMDKKYDFPSVSIWFFGAWIVMHLLGGSVYIGKTRLYDLILFNLFNGGGEFVILKYDQFVHAYCYFTISILTYFALKKHMKSGQGVAITIFAVLSAIGIGLLNEVIEFAMVIFANAASAVGGYYNTALDLVFNLIGALIGPIYANKLINNK